MSKPRSMCLCGCDSEATWLASGQDYVPLNDEGVKPIWFNNEPMCDGAVQHCEEAARELGLSFAKWEI